MDVRFGMKDGQMMRGGEGRTPSMVGTKKLFLCSSFGIIVHQLA